MTSRVDWWRVITDLMQAGLSQREIGRRCNCGHATINSLRNAVTDHEPLYTTGVQILALWMEVRDLGAKDVPMVGTSTGARGEHRAEHPLPGAIAHAPSPEDPRRDPEREQHGR